MNETQITFSGWVGTDITVSETRSGPVATFRVGSTPRRFVAGAWQDLPTNWFTVKAWRGLAENVAASLRRGDAVVVTGRFTADVWEREGERSVRSTVVATTIGHDLSKGTAVFTKSSRSEAVGEVEEEGVRRVIHGYDESGPNLDSEGNEIPSATPAEAPDSAVQVSAKRSAEHPQKQPTETAVAS